MTRSFSPTDKPRKRKPAPGTPEEVLSIMRGIVSLLDKLEADELYPTLYNLTFSTLKGQDYQPKVSQMDSDAIFDAAADLEDDSKDHIPGPRQRDAGALRSAAKELDDMLKLGRSVKKTLEVAVGVPVKRRGRPSGWMKSA